MSDLVHDHTPDPGDPESCLHACRACLIEAGIGDDLMPVARPVSDLDVFTTAELEQQSDLYYANGARLYAAAIGYAGHTGQAGRAGHLLMSAAMEQFELQGAVCLELARRFAETGSANG